MRCDELLKTFSTRKEPICLIWLIDSLIKSDLWGNLRMCRWNSSRKDVGGHLCSRSTRFASGPNLYGFWYYVFVFIRCGCQLFMYKQLHLVDHKHDLAWSWCSQDWLACYQYLLYPFFISWRIISPFSQLWQFRSARQRGNPSTKGQKKWNDSAVKWPFLASLRTINMSPSNLQILKSCLPYTQVITHLLCDVWVCSSPLFALCSHHGPAPGFFLPLLLAQGSDTIFS